MASFPFSSKTTGLVVEAVVAGSTATTMQTLFLHANVDRWAVDAPNKEATVQRLLRNLRETGSNGSEYLLTGLLTCTHYQKPYVGTAATGKLYRYRYYICITRYRGVRRQGVRSNGK